MRQGLHLQVLGPQRDPGVAGLASEPQALIDQPTPHPRPARRRLDQQQAQLCGGRPISGRAEHTSDAPTVDLGDPARFPLITSVDESRHDPCDGVLERRIPVVLGGIVEAVALHYPGQITPLEGSHDQAGKPSISQLGSPDDSSSSRAPRSATLRAASCPRDWI